MDPIKDFLEYREAIGDRVELYRTVARRFNVDTALYPGSHIDIMPSFVIPEVTYIDSYKGTINFFRDIEPIKKYVESQKSYEKETNITFFEGDYKLHYPIESVDLIISQYAGFVGQETKKYLKKGGILLCNDSHGDATLAFCDRDYEFIGVVNSKNIVVMENLEIYFQFIRRRPIDSEKVRTTMKGLKYKINAENYLFRKICR